MIISGIFGTNEMQNRSGTSVTAHNRAQLQATVDGIIVTALKAARRAGKRKLRTLAEDVFYDVTIKAVQTYRQSSRIQEIARGAQAMFLVNALEVR